METAEESRLVGIAQSIRESIIAMLLEAGSGHSAGSLDMADVFTALYFGGVVRHDPQQPDWPGRDRVLLSNGHINPVLYATLAHAGYFSKTELLTLRKLSSRLQGHPHLGSLPGVENTSGPLGQGLSQAAGLALALKFDHLPNRVYALLSDGEHQEGETWEAYMFAAAKRLNNLTVLIDRNTIQIDGFTEDIMPLEPLSDKLSAFGWQVLEVDGHNIGAIIDVCNHAKSIQEQPVAIVCNTTPGKGVEFMENLPEWHGKTPSFPDSIEAIREIRSLNRKITW
ncbi:transketolase [Candidatus Woesebacteria bacterium]|nr:transketolase [Candidatus Woesebacteria bacterium]